MKAMTRDMDDDNSSKSGKDSLREARLKLALRENLKRRKSQARGRAGMTVVTPEDDAAAHRDDKQDR